MSKTSEGLQPEVYEAQPAGVAEVVPVPQAPMETMGKLNDTTLYFADRRFVVPGVHYYSHEQKKNLIAISPAVIKVMHDRLFPAKKLNRFQRLVQWLVL